MEAPTKGAPWRRWPAARAKRDDADARPRKGRRGRWGVERAHTRRADACRAPVPYKGERDAGRRAKTRKRRWGAAGDGRFASSPAGGGTAGVRAFDEGPGDGVTCDRHARRVPRVNDGGVHAAWTATCTPPSTSRCATRPGGGRGDRHHIIRRVGCWMLDGVWRWRLALAFGVARAPTKILDDTGINSNVRTYGMNFTYIALLSTS